MRAIRRNADLEPFKIDRLARPRLVRSPGHLRDRGYLRDRSCGICGRPTLEDLLDAAGDVGVLHRTCFVRWDSEQEALEQAFAKATFGFPHHAETDDLELERVHREVVAATVARPGSPLDERRSSEQSESSSAIAA